MLLCWFQSMSSSSNSLFLALSAVTEQRKICLTTVICQCYKHSPFCCLSESRSYSCQEDWDFPVSRVPLLNQWLPGKEGSSVHQVIGGKNSSSAVDLKTLADVDVILAFMRKTSSKPSWSGCNKPCFFPAVGETGWSKPFVRGFLGLLS